VATGFSRIFTLEVDGRPTLAFEADSTNEARQIAKESWLRDDLTSLRSEGVSICSARSKFLVRPATHDETAAYKQASGATTPSDDMVLAYLINLDG
jgi:hypothetical protein